MTPLRPIPSVLGDLYSASRLFALAAVVLALLASACGGSGAHVVVDESAPAYRGVGLGSTGGAVERALGHGSSAGGFAPIGRLPADVAVPLALPLPLGAARQRPKLLRYANAAFLLVDGRVFAMLLTDSRLRTKRGVAIGGEMKDVQRSYGSPSCYRPPSGESSSGGGATYPVCRVAIGRRRFLSFGGDPIRSFTFYARHPVRGSG